MPCCRVVVPLSQYVRAQHLIAVEGCNLHKKISSLAKQTFSNTHALWI
jgi:hypothetical protein